MQCHIIVLALNWEMKETIKEHFFHVGKYGRSLFGSLFFNSSFKLDNLEDLFLLTKDVSIIFLDQGLKYLYKVDFLKRVLSHSSINKIPLSKVS